MNSIFTNTNLFYENCTYITIPHSFTKSSYIHLHSALQDNGMNDESDEESVFGVNEKGLWVDKYSPKAYVELLSDDVSTLFSTV